MKTILVFKNTFENSVLIAFNNFLSFELDDSTIKSNRFKFDEYVLSQSLF